MLYRTARPVYGVGNREDRMSFSRAALLFALFFALVGRASPCLAETVDVYIDAAYPPFMYATADQKAAGVYPALIAEAFSRAGLAVKLHAVPWKRALAESEAGMGGIGGIYMNEQRLMNYDYSDAIFVERIQAVIRKDKAFPFAGLSSLAGKRVGVLRGWSYGDAFDQARAAGLFKAEEVDNDAQNLAKLKAGRIEVMIAGREGADASIALSDRPQDFLVLEPPLVETAAYLAFSKRLGKRDVIALFNQALALMRQDGTWDMIVMGILARP
jgi:polar amino acid transport system substrate-binding protein